MSSYLYIPNNVKYHKKIPYIGLYEKLQNLYSINDNTFQKKAKLITTPDVLCYYYFVFETVFITGKIAGHNSGALQEISDQFLTKLNVSSYMILQFRLNTVWKIL